ncbi:MAG: DNA replication and repair protein RecF [Flavobacteriales bacterium]|nr:DNA replication and repair protein RecF [Flavobacteriales bacterium]
MHLKQLSLVNFKNISGADMELGKKFNCFVGNNGSGKTTVLDAVHYLSMCKSFLNSVDSQNIQRDQPFMVVSGTFERNAEEEKVYCALKRDGKKQFKRNKKEYGRLIDHVGLFPSVIIAPTDSDIINGGSELRRKFLDSVISQLDREYLENLVQYNKALLQRNALLKYFRENRTFQSESLEIWDAQLSQRGQLIYERRKAFLSDFIQAFSAFYKTISGSVEEVGLIYESQLNEGLMLDQLRSNVAQDRAATYTTIGIHKDDLGLMINDFPVKKFGSQGQQKSALVALKLAQFKVMHEKSGITPLLLLDDIFDKLDDDRVGQLLKLVSGKAFGQIFITDTHPARVAELLKDEKDVRVFPISQGEFREITPGI